jgi:hypothetical protein
MKMDISYYILRCFGLRGHDHVIARSFTRPEWLYRSSVRIPKAPFTLPAASEPGAEDRELCRRLIAAWEKAKPRDMPYGRIWSRVIREHYEPLQAVLEQRDANGLATLLCRMFRSSCLHGIAHGDLYRIGNINNFAKRAWQLKLLDDCVSLGEYLGVVRVENPEQRDIGLALSDGVPALIRLIEDRLGEPVVSFPRVGSPYGFDAEGCLITMESPEHIYVGARIREAVRVHLPEVVAPEVIEIGGGFGGLAYYLLRLLPSISAYTIVDLPIVNVLQGYFLGRCFGADAVSLLDEPRARIRVLPPDVIGQQSCDVLINENSMPEMPPETVLGYLRWAALGVRGIFYSYQQEAWTDQVLLHSVIEDEGAFRRLSRNRSWVRRGYVEEVYAVGSLKH